MILYFVAGEASGDGHGAALMQALRKEEPTLKFHGRGGPRMKAIAGNGFLNWIDSAAILGLWEVIKHYGYFRAQFRETVHEIRNSQPNAVILIDYPGFNLRLARALRRMRPDLKIVYYISPQVWAWNRRRIPRMARWIDLMLCIFPFEVDLYNRSGLRTIFVGHPMIKDLERHRIETDRRADLIGLFPGSRVREIRKIFPIMLSAARQISEQRAGARFEVAAGSASLAKEIERELSRSSIPKEMVNIIVGETSAVMQRASIGIIASGTATLEAAFFRLPFVLVYKVSWLTYLAARLVVRVKHLGMPNVLAGREIVPEFIQHRANPYAIATAALKLSIDPSAREGMISQFDAIIAKLGQEDAGRTAAQAILHEIGRAESTI